MKIEILSILLNKISISRKIMGNDMRVLLYIISHNIQNGTIFQYQIANDLEVDRATVSKIIKRLINYGLLETPVTFLGTSNKHFKLCDFTIEEAMEWNI